MSDKKYVLHIPKKDNPHYKKYMKESGGPVRQQYLEQEQGVSTGGLFKKTETPTHHQYHTGTKKAANFVKHELSADVGNVPPLKNMSIKEHKLSYWGDGKGNTKGDTK